MNNVITQNKKLFFSLILIILFIPWFNNDFGFEQTAAKVSQESVAFYEINPCKVSILEFLAANPNSLYQDHYHFRFNNYSSINCFGRISGATVIGSDFFISVGTNSFINLLYQGLFWIYLFSKVKKNHNYSTLEELQTFTSKLTHYTALILTSLLYGFSIYAEKRFYEKNLYYFNFDSNFYKLLIILLIYFILNNLINITRFRTNKIFEMLPYVYLFYSVFSGFNFTLFSGIVIYFGFISFINNKINWKINKVIVWATLWWVLNSRESYYFNPGKFKGFTSSIYEFNASIFWCLYFILFINGLWYLFNKTIQNFSLQRFINNFSISGIIILTLGFIGANFPIINFFNYFYFGQQKFGITRNNPFAFDSWAEKLSWRGFYASAESIGEFFGLFLILLAYSYYKKKTLNTLEIVGGIFSLLGLYFSDNRTAMILVFIFTTYFLLNESKYKKIGLISAGGIFTGLLLYLIGFESFTYSYEFVKTRLFMQANYYQYDTVFSSFMIWMNENQNNGSLLRTLFDLFSTLAYFLNRSEIWGIFFARYNPTFFEFILGSGPFNFGQLYGEIVINKTETFLLPHSSLLSFLIFFGFAGSVLILLLFIKLYSKNKYQISSLGKMLLVYMFMNIVKNDVLNYFSSFTMCLFLFFTILNRDNEEVFKL
jgi:hypothetical protein